MREKLEALISQALAEKLFTSRHEAIICASVANPIELGRRRPEIEDLQAVIEVRRRHKIKVDELWK